MNTPSFCGIISRILQPHLKHTQLAQDWMMEHTRRSFLGQTLGTAVSTALCGSAALTATLGMAAPSTSLANSIVETTTETVSSASLKTDRQNQWYEVLNSNETRRLRMINVHTGEKISVVYRKSESYVDAALQQINFLLRDYRANEVMQIDTATIDYLYKIYMAMDTDEYIQILSGYRSAATNEMLRKRSSRVAKKSLHIVGKAVDFRIPGRPIKDLQLAALEMKIGGIGYYPKSGFVHIDSGHFRHW